MKKFRNDIQGLRALAVLSVMMFHVNKSILPGGFVGVDMFLVISGYLITSIIIRKKKSNEFSFKEFYMSRFKRIVPAYLFLLSITSLCMGILLIQKDFNFFKNSLVSSLYFNSNHYFSKFGNYFAPNSYELPLLHTWSLAVEMKFYFFLPFLIILTYRKYQSKIILSIAVFFLIFSSYILTNRDYSQEIYFSTYARIPEFLIGSLIAVMNIPEKINVYINNVLSFVGLILIVLSILYIDSSMSFPGYVALPVCIGTALLIVSYKSVIGNLFSHPSIVFIGSISYSLYLWHWPVLVIIRYYTGKYILNTSQLLFFLLITFSFSLISYRWIETFFKKNNQKKTYKVKFLFVATALSILVSVLSNKYLLAPLPDEFNRYAPKDKICHSKIVDDCYRGDKKSQNDILLIGDSHAAQLNLFADVIGKIHNIKFKVITSSSCVTIPGFNSSHIPQRSQIDCRKQIEEVIRIIPHYKTIVIGGMWSYQLKNSYFLKSLEEFIVSHKKNKIIILAQVPELNNNVLRFRRFKHIGLNVKINLAKNWKKSNLKLKSISSKYDNVYFLDFSKDSIFHNAPYFKGKLMYFDKSHLNEYGAIQYGKYVANHLNKKILLN